MATPAAEIRKYLLGLTRSGKLKPGDRAPSRPTVERRFRCARATVDRAYSELLREGVLRSEVGRGTFVAVPTRRSAGPGAASLLIVIPERGPEWQRDLFTFGIYRELVRGLTERGREVLGTVEEPGAAGKRNADGGLFEKAKLVYWVRPEVGMLPLMQELAAQHVGQVLLNRDYGPFPCVVTDASGGHRLAVKKLAELGHRRIGYLHPPSQAPNWINAERVIGFLEGLREVRAAEGGAARLEFPAWAGPAEEAGVVEWLKGPEAPTAVIFHAYWAERLLRLARTAGRRVPKDLALVSVDEIYDPFGLLGMSFTCLRQRLGEIGQRASELEPSALATPSGPLKVRLLPEWVAGESTGAGRG